MQSSANCAIAADELYELKFDLALTAWVRYDSSVMSFQQPQGEKMVLAFDPGGTTGVALVDGTGAILRTEAFSPSEAITYARRMAVKRRAFNPPGNFLVLIEKGPEWQQHSPITRSVEVKLREIFPDAHLVTPNRWKGHPASKCAEKVPTRHEKDAVRLARWFLFTSRSISANFNDQQVEETKQRKTKRTKSSRSHTSRSRRVHN